MHFITLLYIFALKTSTKHRQLSNPMAQFKTIVSRYKRADGSRRIKIRITHNNSNTEISTPFYVYPTQVTKGGKIKDAVIDDACTDIIRQWRHQVTQLGYAVLSMSATELAEYLKRCEARAERIDFVKHILDIADTKTKEQTAHNYRTVAHSFAKFLRGVPLDINDLSPQMLSAYEEWLRSEGIASGTIAQYFAIVKSAHNSARKRYNDEDAGIIRVTRTPFAKFKMPQPPAPEAKAVNLATLQAIANLPDISRINARRNAGRDLFMLSFALSGINYTDLYYLPYSAWKGSYIEYRRTKTKDARADGAYYRAYVCPEIRPLIERWLDPTKARLFRFHLKWSVKSFREVIVMCVKEVEKAVPFSRHYTFYSARHTFASLARNTLGFDKYTVHELLNHADSEMRITDRYIERDWLRIFDAQQRVVRLVDWHTICNS